MRRMLPLLCAVLALATSAGAARAATFIVQDFKADGSQANDARVMAKMLRTELGNLNDTRVYDEGDERCFSVKCAKRIRRERGVDAVVVGELTVFGGQLTLLLDVVWKDEIFSYNPGLADVQEYRKIVKRLAESIRKRDTFESTRGVDSVSKEEMDPYKNKIKGMWKLGFSLGMLAPVADTMLGADAVIGILPRFRYEIANVGIEGETGVYYSSNLVDEHSLTAFPLEFGTHYYFMNRDFSPFLGATFGVHLLYLDFHMEQEEDTYEEEGDYYFAHEDTFWMFTVGAYAGIELLRTHTFQINFRAGYKYGFVDFGDAALAEGVNEGAHGVFMQVGVTFSMPKIKAGKVNIYYFQPYRHRRY